MHSNSKLISLCITLVTKVRHVLSENGSLQKSLNAVAAYVLYNVGRGCILVLGKSAKAFMSLEQNTTLMDLWSSGRGKQMLNYHPCRLFPAVDDVPELVTYLSYGILHFSRLRTIFYREHRKCKKLKKHVHRGSGLPVAF